MGYHYDPILCMNVPDSTSKAKDAKALDDSKADFQKVISLTKQIDDITKRYARKIDANAMFAYTDQIRRKVQYYIDNSDRGWYDSAPADVRDAKYKVFYGIRSNMKSTIIEASSEEEAIKSYMKSSKYPGTVQKVEKVNDSIFFVDRAIRTADDENERWITMNGSHVKIDGEGNAIAGNEKVKSIINSKKKSETAGKSEKKQAEGSKKETYKSYSDFKKNSGAEDLLQFVDEVAFDAGHDEKDPDKEDLKRIGKEFQDVYEKIKDHPNAGEYVNKMRREINNMIEEAIGTSLYDYSYLGIKELNETLKIFNKYYD